MTAAHLKIRSSRSLADKGRTIAQAHPYVVAAAATVGALAISALMNRHLAKKAEADNPPADARHLLLIRSNIEVALFTRNEEAEGATVMLGLAAQPDEMLALLLGIRPS